MDKPSKNKPAAGRYALLDELRGLDLLSMMGSDLFVWHVCRMVYGLAGAPVAAEHLLGGSFCCLASACRWGIARCGAG